MYNVLICDDDIAILNSIEIYLNMEGYKPFLATNGKEALKIISEFPDTITEKELARAKEQSVASFVMNLENVSSRTSRNGRNALLYNKITSEDEVVGKIRSVTLEEAIEAGDKLAVLCNEDLVMSVQYELEEKCKTLFNK